MTVNIIAEIGSNWEGDVELGKLHIKESKECGATHVKFQMWRAEDIYEKSDPNWDAIKRSELTEEVARELKKYADRIGIKWFCSVFNPESVDFLESVEVEMYKIASWTTALKHKFALETIKRVGKTKKPTFISTGYGIDKKIIERQFQEKVYQYTYCIANYPAQDEEIVWQDLLKYDFFSDHTLGYTIPLSYAILKKMCGSKDIFIEKHVKQDSSSGPDSPFSISFNELRNLTNHIQRIDQLNMCYKLNK